MATPFRNLPWMLLAGLAMLPAGAHAQLGTPDTNAPISVQADNGIEWQQNKQLYIARGNALASRGPATIKANTLIAHYREAKGNTEAGSTPTGNTTGNAAPTNPLTGSTGNNEIYRIEADGNVVITRDSRTVVGDHADYDLDQGIGIVRGHALKMTTATDVITARDAFEWYDQKQIAVARGDAVAVRQGGRTIKADTLTAYMVKTAAPGTQGAASPAKPVLPAKPGATTPGKPNEPPASGEESKINRIDAQGHVVVINGPDIGRGDYGVYNAATDICTLLGNVTITRGKDVITGQYAVMDMNTNISRIMPASALPGATRQRVQGLFVKQDLTGAKTEAAPSAPAGGAAPKSITVNSATPKGR